MKKHADPISKHMTPAPYTIESDRSLADAHRLMREHKIRHLPVVKDGNLVGIVSQRDLHLLETLGPMDLERVPVAEAMTKDPYCVEPNTPLGEVVREMARRHLGSALVVQEGRVVGIYTAVDALKDYADLLGAPQSSTTTRTPR